MDATVQLADLSTGYRGKTVTKDINATLHDGELTCLLGPNGAGKSTLLKTLCAFIPPLSGSILIGGKDIRNIAARSLARLIGVVLTERPAATNLTVKDLVAIGRSPYTGFFGGYSSADLSVVDEAMEMVGITSLSARMASTLSDGERQKAFIAKALAQQTDIIFLDEPTAFLDYPSKVDIMKLLYRLAREQRKTVFLSTHDLDLALQTADKIWLLDRSHGLEIGIPEDLAYKGLLSDYFSTDDLRFIPGECRFEIIHQGHGKVCLTGQGTLAMLVAKALYRRGFIPVSHPSPRTSPIATLTPGTSPINTLTPRTSPINTLTHDPHPNLPTIAVGEKTITLDGKPVPDIERLLDLLHA